MNRKIIMSITATMSFVCMAFGQYDEELNLKLFNDYKGEIIFSNSKIDLKDFQEKDLKKNFDLMDNIYAQIVMNKTLEQCYQANNYVFDYNNAKYTYNYALILFVDGV